MPALKPVYLIHGDDHGAVGERRAGLRALAESGGGDSVELLEGEQASPAGVAGALAAMTLSVGRRVLVVEGRRALAGSGRRGAPAAGSGVDAARDDVGDLRPRGGRAKVPPALQGAVKKAGGVIGAQMTMKPWELSKMGARAGRAARPGSSMRPPPRRWSSRSESASSACCASSRSWPSKARTPRPMRSRG